jgi:RimJ/RimL family protein N-acetyltransferase
LAGDLESVEAWLGAPPPSEWLAAQASMRRRLAQLEADPTLLPWLLRAVILRSTSAMIGYVTFHTAPDPEYLQPIAAGAVEIGYSIYPPFRRQGFAKEAVAALMAWAAQEHGVARFVLSIRPDNEPSQRIAKHFGFRKVGSQMDEIDGLEDIFLLEINAPPKVQSATYAG